jgi:hypothetical protein
MTRNRLLVFLLLFLLVLPACAQNNNINQQTLESSDPVKLALAKELIAITHSDNDFKNFVTNLSKSFAVILARDNPQKQELINVLIEKYFIPTFMEHIGELNDHTAVLYAQYFSKDDLSQIIAFYRSPVGQRYTGLLPQIAQESMPFVKDWSARMGQIATQKLIDQLKQNNMAVPKEMGL